MQPEMTKVLADLDAALVAHEAPQLRYAKRPPVSAADLAALRDAARPYELPDDLVTLLQWSDGFSEELMPSLLSDDFPSARQLAREYVDTPGIANEDGPQWPMAWLPVVVFSDGQLVLDLVLGGRLLQTQWGSNALLGAPGLAAALDVARRVLAAGLPLRNPEMDEIVEDSTWHADVSAIARSSYDWQDWPYDINIGGPHERDAWPREWWESIGAPPVSRSSDAIAPIPIAALPDHDTQTTIEGYVVGYAALASRSDYPAHDDPRGSVPRVFVIEDATGTAAVLRATAEGFWVTSSPEVDPVRVRLNIRVGPSARQAIDELLEPWPWADDAPRPVAIANGCRAGLQSSGVDRTLRLLRGANG